MSKFRYCPLKWHFCTEEITRKIDYSGKTIEIYIKRSRKNKRMSTKPINLPSLKLRTMRKIVTKTIFKIRYISPVCYKI